MALIRLDPLFAELAGTKDRLNRLFGRDESLETEGVVPAGDWTPTVDILEGDRDITIKAELPGIEAKDIAVTLDNNVLTLKGERRLEQEVKKENYHRMERTFGVFSRSFALPAFVDEDQVKAEFKNGLLTLILPKKEDRKTRKIDVNAP